MAFYKNEATQGSNHSRQKQSLCGNDNFKFPNNYMDEQKNVPMPIQVSKLQGFIDFIREQGVVGLAIGFILGGAVSKIVGSLVDNVINPIVGIILGKVDLAERMITIGQASIKWGAFVSSIIDFVVIAAVVYFGFKMLGLEKLDRKKE